MDFTPWRSRGRGRGRGTEESPTRNVLCTCFKLRGDGDEWGSWSRSCSDLLAVHIPEIGEGSSFLGSMKMNERRETGGEGNG